ncbi:uncharacterized protein LOC113313404 [Papaver somniferum]|uniref:uncharacterized protein LOC113313404 n=1 Tax=Papaver somniferum TaxID=3469 RepID=UPI000E702462|nr:uncharacterized protein LOC113313404 [Papaver somniferum]XP_026417949.1 uncharacterized protein LOC113313404 [Papaver somniferum]XP_026417950.1 uncharacterized protein LOC113313404 [Papaver somniferum]XP_026417951.1 uncharacterized protein LOC113313404 [Papaver somniferum]XP_026417952.1 uncharacterized protein LOC113313404 [Papaver somniferum]XP_026417953.1 uncharacterized protein LOC113313404 [Papaver somniferum]
MISLSLNCLLIKPSPLSQHNHLKLLTNLNPKLNNNNQRRRKSFRCRANFSVDAPFAIAIGASILNSLVFPIPNVPNEEDEEEEEDSTITNTDSRFAVMGIISFVPYFNWLSWVFALLDTGDRRYAVYSIVYLAPYIRTNLSLSTDESWLPIASIILCIIHIQLEASIRNGDLQGFQLFSGLAKKKGAHLKGRATNPKKGKIKENIKLPSAQNRLRDEVQGWGEVFEKPLDDPESLSEGGAQDKRKD